MKANNTSHSKASAYVIGVSRVLSLALIPICLTSPARGLGSRETIACVTFLFLVLF